MAKKIRFCRGSQDASLPDVRQDGTIFVIERANSSDGTYPLGDMYVDVDNEKRLHIIPDPSNNFFIYNSETMSGKKSKLGIIYIVTDINNNQIGIKVGDGITMINNLPIYSIEQITKSYIDTSLTWSRLI